MTSFEDHFRASLSPAYDIERELLGGGMSRVFVATDRALGRKVVIKVLPPELTAGVNRDRFRREIQVAAQLQHPHIVTLLSAGEDGELLYYTMPYIEGESLKQAIEENGALPVKTVVRILHDVVDALAYAHARGVVHRDIKPGNILQQGAHALVTDFGVAKALNAAMPASGITTAGMAIGTPAYMAPEQLAGDPASDHRIDIYAVGLLAYELLTGEAPFKGASPQATMAAQLTKDPEPLHICCPDVPLPLSAIIMQCLAKQPEDRPPDAEALMSALESITTPSGDIRSGGVAPVQPARRRKVLMPVAVGLTTVVLGSAVVVFASQRNQPRTATQVTHKLLAVEQPLQSDSQSGTANAAAKPVAPLALTRLDSLAIAEAVQKRLAQEESARGRVMIGMLADSITAHVRKGVIDSILKANLPRGAAMPQWRDVAPPPEWGGRRRVVVTEPHAGKQENLNSFGKLLADSLRSAIGKTRGLSVVDADSVSKVLSVSRARKDVVTALAPEFLISPTFIGTGDTMTVLVTVRDVRVGQNGSPMGSRVVSAKFATNSPDASVPGIVRSVSSQIESLMHSPSYMRMIRSGPPAPSNPEARKR